jgi:hypothetical protein
MPRLLLEYASGRKSFVSCYVYSTRDDQTILKKQGVRGRRWSPVPLRQDLWGLARTPSRLGLAAMATTITISQSCA